MTKHTANRIQPRVISLLLAVLLLMEMSPKARADSVYSVYVHDADSVYDLGVHQFDGKWYVDGRQLASIGKLSFTLNEKMGHAYIVKQEPFTVLYDAGSSDYIISDNTVYLPLAECTVASGFRFFIFNDEMHFEVIRTPKELISELSRNVFGNSRFRLSDLYLEMGKNWIVAETAARGFAILSSFSLSAYIEALSGEADQERYNKAMATIITNDSADVGAFADLADINKCFTKADKILDTFDWLFEKSDKFRYWLSGDNWMQAEFKTYSDQLELYGELIGVREFLDAYADVSKALDLKYVFNVILYIETALEAEENVVNAMKKVFSTSDNEHASMAASKVVANRYGAGLAAVDVAGNAAIEVYSKQIDSLFTDLVFGEKNWKTKVDKFIATQIFDYGFQLPAKSEAIIYVPIYSSIQQDLATYYYNNNQKESNDNYTDLRSVGIMYLKAAMAAYRNFDFDDDLRNTVSEAVNTLQNELNLLLSYGECEYAPDYDNQVLVDWLNNGNGNKLPEEPDPEKEPGKEDVSVIPGPDDYDASALQAYAGLLRRGVELQYDWAYAPAQYYALLDLNQDRIPQLIVYGDQNGRAELSFRLYAFRNGSVEELANAWEGCDISTWGNAMTRLEVYDGSVLHAAAIGASLGRMGYASHFLYRYDGSRLSSEKAVPPETYHSVVDLLTTGTPIGSNEDWLSGLAPTPVPPSPTPAPPTPPATPKPSPTPPPEPDFPGPQDVDDEVDVFKYSDDCTEKRITVQLCAGYNLNACFDIVRRLRESGWNAYIVKCDTHYRVSVGAYKSKADAERAGTLDRLNASGVKGIDKNGGYYTNVYLTPGAAAFYEEVQFGSSGSSTPQPKSALPDGEYTGRLVSWTDTSMTVNLFDYEWNDIWNYERSFAGDSITLDISEADVWLDTVWNDYMGEIWCSSIDEAMNCLIWESPFRSLWAGDTSFIVYDGKVTSIVCLYSP